MQFDRLGPTPPGPFNLDIGTSEKLELNAGDGDDEITGRRGLAGLIESTLNGDEGNDRIKGTDGEDLLTGGKGFDVIRSRDHAADRVECNGGFDLALVDKRDTVRGCEIVLGGFLRVKHSAKSVSLAGSTAALKLKCLASGSCKGKVQAGLQGQEPRLEVLQDQGQEAHDRRGSRSASAECACSNNASQKGLKVQLRIDAKDSKGNGWRTSDPLRLKL